MSYLTRCLRLYFYVHKLKKHKCALMKLTLQHNFYNNLLPMRTGELSFPLLMKHYFKVPLATSAGTLIWFRLLDLKALCLLGMSSWAFLGQGNQAQLSYYVIYLLILGCLITPYILFEFNRRFRPAPMRAGSNHWVAIRLKRIWIQLQPGLPSTYSHYISSNLLTLLNWSVKLYTFTLILQSLAPLTTSTAIIGAIAGELTSVLPVHGIGGIGTYEAAVAAPLYLQGTPKATAVSAAINLHLLILASTGISYLISLALPTAKTRP